MVEGGTRLMEGEGFAGSLRAANKALDPIQNIRTASRKLALEEDIALRKAIAVGAAKDTDMSRRIAALKAGGYTPEQIADAVETGVFSQRAIDKIYFTAHSSTQGLPDPVFMPHFMSTQFMKPFTLFYRIAYRVTENVYKNAYRPLIDNGEIAPMARYIAASMGAGYALQNTYYQLFN